MTWLLAVLLVLVSVRLFFRELSVRVLEDGIRLRDRQLVAARKEITRHVQHLERLDNDPRRLGLGRDGKPATPSALYVEEYL